jgi:hypothetical protein
MLAFASGPYPTDNIGESEKKTLLRDGKEVLRDASFAEASPTVYAISFRTGEFRGTVPDRAKKDMKDTEAPVPAAIYRVDDVKTSTR